jgi:stage V sporulation protein B
MKPTAISQIIEQVVKVALGLLLATAFINNTPLAVGGATLAITVSEICGVIYLAILWKKREKKYCFQNGKEVTKIVEKELSIRTILKAVIPITLIGITMPFSQVIDSFLIVNLLKNTNNATGIYGIYSGVSLTIINLPISICHGLAVATVPSVSSAKDTFDRRDKEKYLIKITLVISLIASAFVLFLSKPLVNILFSSLSSEDKNLAIKLIKTLSVVIVLLSLLQTQNSIFIAKGKYFVPLITMFISVVIKSILEYFLIKNQYLNIFGGAISLITCYFIANLLNFILIKDFGANNASKKRKYPEFEN